MSLVARKIELAKVSVLGLLLTLSFAKASHAMSLDPCTPVVDAMDTQVSCMVSETEWVSVKIHTVMTDRNACPDPAQYRERRSATLEKIFSNDSIDASITLSLKENAFNYDLGTPGPGDARFSYYDGSRWIYLSNCVTPVYGAVSFGNLPAGF